ncbi:MAG: hypothetical protein F4Y98_01805 [Chloroflexi bacterium]|nr:hypothetical protein [Chloroflexota bacterium]
MARILSKEEAEELLEPFGGLEAALEGLRESEANRQYLEAHREEFERQYPDEWIGLLHQRVVAHGTDPEKVRQAVVDAGGDPHSVFLEHLTTEEQVWLL